MGALLECEDGAGRAGWADGGVMRPCVGCAAGVCRGVCRRKENKQEDKGSEER